ncbi:amidohydrolase family protein [Brachybacterium hainanense]|uniref:Amidohydrolase family protein n=1 Tax=Brachybacterium hainanense TaxID=1541174 RepID=A0ABV6RB89_9MICO
MTPTHAAPPAAPLDLEAARASLRIIDAHHHFWDLEGPGRYPWLQDAVNPEFFLGDYAAMRRTFLPREYRAATTGWNVIGTVHCEAERSRDEQLAEDEFLAQLHEADPGFPLAIVGHVDFLQDDLAEILAGHARHPLVRGIRSKPRIAARRGESVRGETGTLQDRTWQDGLRRLADLDLSWDLRVPYYHLSEAAEVISQVAGLRVIINHCGLPLDRDPESLAVWRRGMRELADLPGTSVKVSELGLFPNRWDPASNAQVVRELLGIFGFERSMFASNLPVATLTAPSFDAVMESILAGAAGASAEQLAQLFAGTAAREYRLRDVLDGS